MSRGEFERGEASRITGLPERIARRVLNDVLTLGLLASDTPKGPVSLAFLRTRWTRCFRVFSQRPDPGLNVDETGSSPKSTPGRVHASHGLRVRRLASGGRQTEGGYRLSGLREPFHLKRPDISARPGILPGQTRHQYSG